MPVGTVFSYADATTWRPFEMYMRNDYAEYYRRVTRDRNGNFYTPPGLQTYDQYVANFGDVMQIQYDLDHPATAPAADPPPPRSRGPTTDPFDIRDN